MAKRRGRLLSSKALCLLLFGFICICSQRQVQAQDAQFSQFFAMPLHHNPALAGGTLGGRVAMSARVQWPQLAGNFTHIAAGYDQFFPANRSAAGALITSERAGVANFSTTTFSGNYTYLLPISKTWVFRAALQPGIASRSASLTRLTFGDQISGEQQFRRTQDPAGQRDQSITYFDLASGLLLHDTRWFFSLGAFHLTQPSQQLFGEETNLPIRYNLMAGYNLPLKSPPAGTRETALAPVKKALMPMVHYRRQGPFQQLDIGANIYLEGIYFGAWYRGIPVLETVEGIHNHEALTATVGIEAENISIGYSYDLSLSALQPLGGAHEVTLGYLFAQDYRRGSKYWRVPWLPRRGE